MNVSFKAGRLANFKQNWATITKDSVILSWIEGYHITFVRKVRQRYPPPERSWSKTEEQDMQCEISHLLQIKAIQRCNPCKGQFISRIFLVQKPNKKRRLILNLKELNKFIVINHFKMEDKSMASKLITPNCYLATVDLKEAYFLIRIHKKYRKFLRFIFQGHYYEFTCMPFGLCSAPFVFTKLLKPVVHYLRKNNFLSVVYLDDFLLIGENYNSCLANLKATVSLLQDLGFVINVKKSQLNPKKQCKFLGFLFNSENMTLELIKEKRINLHTLAKKVSCMEKCTIRFFACFVGKLVAACPGLKYAWVYVKNFERAIYLALKRANQNYNKLMVIPKYLKNDFHWWISNIPIGCNSIKINKYSLEIFSDASLSGFGICCGGQTTHGHWNKHEKSFHINRLELLAAFFGLKCFAKDMQHCNILLRIDNTTAISYINRMGGIRFQELNKLTKEIWQWCESRDMHIFASYIQSGQNTIADAESRKLPHETEYELSEQVFNELVQKFGTPVIDLFASRNNRKCDKFISWRNDPEAWAVDAFTVSWSKGLGYAFPPFAVILRVLQKIIIDKARIILVVPCWPTQAWYPLFTQLSVTELLHFSPDKNLVLSVDRKPHPLWRKLSLVASLLSNEDLVARGYQPLQQKS